MNLDSKKKVVVPDFLNVAHVNHFCGQRENNLKLFQSKIFFYDQICKYSLMRCNWFQLNS